jgi:hypothetical protein
MTLSITKTPTGNPFDCHGLKYGYCEWETIGMKFRQTFERCFNNKSSRLAAFFIRSVAREVHGSAFGSFQP